MKTFSEIIAPRDKWSSAHMVTDILRKERFEGWKAESLKAIDVFNNQIRKKFELKECVAFLYACDVYIYNKRTKKFYEIQAGSILYKHHWWVFENPKEKLNFYNQNYWKSAAATNVNAVATQLHLESQGKI